MLRRNPNYGPRKCHACGRRLMTGWRGDLCTLCRSRALESIGKTLFNPDTGLMENDPVDSNGNLITARKIDEAMDEGDPQIPGTGITHERHIAPPLPPPPPPPDNSRYAILRNHSREDTDAG